MYDRILVAIRLLTRLARRLAQPHHAVCEEGRWDGAPAPRGARTHHPDRHRRRSGASVSAVRGGRRRRPGGAGGCSGAGARRRRPCPRQSTSCCRMCSTTAPSGRARVRPHRRPRRRPRRLLCDGRPRGPRGPRPPHAARRGPRRPGPAVAPRSRKWGSTAHRTEDTVHDCLDE